jgi:hypothetical protein
LLDFGGRVAVEDDSPDRREGTAEGLRERRGGLASDGIAGRFGDFGPALDAGLGVEGQDGR